MSLKSYDLCMFTITHTQPDSIGRGFSGFELISHRTFRTSEAKRSSMVVNSSLNKQHIYVGAWNATKL